MDLHAKLTALIDLAGSLGMEVRAAPSGWPTDQPGGAYVRLRNKEIVFLEAQASAADQIDVMARALRGRKALEDRFLPPEIRQLLEDG